MSDMIKVLSVCISVAAAIAVLVSSCIMRRQLRVQAYQSVQHILCSINKCFIQFPELRKYFNGGVELPPPESEEYDRVHCMIEMLMDFYDLVYEQRVGMSKRQWSGWKRNIKLVYGTCPGIRNHVQTQDHRYSKGLIALLRNKDS